MYLFASNTGAPTALFVLLIALALLALIIWGATQLVLRTVRRSNQRHGNGQQHARDPFA
jgi:hypothetical protein